MVLGRNLVMHLMLLSTIVGMFTGVRTANAFCTTSTCGSYWTCGYVTGCDYGSCVSVWCLDTESCPYPSSPGYQCNLFGCTLVWYCS